MDLADALKKSPLHVPPELIGGVAEMASLFTAMGRVQNAPKTYAPRLIGLIPEEIRSLPCFLDRLTGLWRYEFGSPMTLTSGHVVSGTHMFNDVARLFEVIGCAQWRLPPSALNAYLAKLVTPEQHESTLSEFAPLLRLSPESMVEYEAAGYGEGNSTIDWRISRVGWPDILLEVKSRNRDLREGIENQILRAESGRGTTAPFHDHSLLFRSVERKFGPRSEGRIRAVWVMTGIKQEASELSAAFDNLAVSRVDAAILGTWDGHAHILARERSTRKFLFNALGLRPSPLATFERDSDD